MPALLASVGDGVYVVAPDGTVAFVNPAGLAILGYEDAADLLGRASHSTIHAHYRDGSPYPEAECPLLRPRETGEAVQVDGVGGLIATAQRGCLSDQVWAIILVAGLFSLLVGALIATLEATSCVTAPRTRPARRAPRKAWGLASAVYLSRLGGT